MGNMEKGSLFSYFSNYKRNKVQMGWAKLRNESVYKYLLLFYSSYTYAIALKII